MKGIKEIFKTLFKRKSEEILDSNSVHEICAELEELAIKKQRITHYIEELNIKEEAHKQYQNLDPEAVAEINALAQKAKGIEEKKSSIYEAVREKEIDKLADIVRERLDINSIYEIMGIKR